MTEEDYTTISPTAVACATIRADYTDIPYAKEVLDALHKKGIKPYLPKWVQKIVYFLPGMKARFSGQEIRYQSTNFALTKTKPSAVLEISAGFSTRGSAVSQDYGLYLETDLPDVIRMKKEIVSELQEVSKNLKFAPLNPLDYNQLAKIGDRFLKKLKQKKIAIVQEGLITYFSPEEQRKVRENIQRFLSEYSPNGVYITPDFSYRKKEVGFFSHLLKLVQRKAKRDYNFFEDDNQVKSFLNEGGLKGKVLDNSEILPGLSCLAKLGIDVSSIRNVTEDYRPWIISLKK